MTEEVKESVQADDEKSLTAKKISKIFKFGLTDVDTTIVHNVGLHHLVAIGLHDLSQTPT